MIYVNPRFLHYNHPSTSCKFSGPCKLGHIGKKWWLQFQIANLWGENEIVRVNLLRFYDDNIIKYIYKTLYQVKLLNHALCPIWNLFEAVDLIGYATEEIETRDANVYLQWKAHIDNVTQIALIDHREMLITSSLDCTCRAWTFDGEFIGTFGQEDRWDLVDAATWKHPFTPDDVLG